jgi:hypothetical protein
VARRSLVSCLLVLATLLALPVVARADSYTLGSDLKADATVEEDHGADSAFWQVAYESGGLTEAPVGGQVVSVKVKGTVLPDPTGRKNPIPMMHFQTLHPMGDGTLFVSLTSGAFYTPIGGDPNTIRTYKPVNMCMQKGDILGFNDIGGNEWWWGDHSGMPFQTFAAVRGSTMNFYTKNAGTMNGSRWGAKEVHQGEELLMQARFVTGAEATDTCPGGYAQHIYKGVDLRDGQTATLRTKIQEAKVRITCPFDTYGSCQGVVRASAVLGGRQVLLGGDTFSSAHGWSDSVNIPVTASVMRAIQRQGSVRVKLTADSHDDPAGEPQRVYGQRMLPRDPSDVVPVQHKTTTATIALKADKPLAKKKHRKRKKHRSRRGH